MRSVLFALFALTVFSASLVSANPAHTALSKLSTTARNQMLTAFMGQSGEQCTVTRAFFQGFAGSTAFWNVACSNGKSFVISIHDDAAGSTKIMPCALIATFGGAKCFTKFE